MAAKPPKPPGPFLKQDKNYLITNNTANNSANSTPIDVYPAETNGNNKCLSANSNNSSCDELQHVIECNEAATNVPRVTCCCTNISIMHLFHEMKQEFPTIPDTIVAQCVNQNCHQRENCIQMLRNELALNPIPVQSYPAKVLHQHQQQQHHHQLQQQQSQQQEQEQSEPQQQQQQQRPPQPPQRLRSQKPPTPLKPIRAAPTTPPVTAIGAGNSAASSSNLNSPYRVKFEAKGSPVPAVRKLNCDSELVNCYSQNNTNNNNNNNNTKQSGTSNFYSNYNEIDNNIAINNKIREISSKLKDVNFANSVNCNSVSNSETTNTSDMPATTTTAAAPAPNATVNNCANDVTVQQQQRQLQSCQNDYVTNLGNGPTPAPTTAHPMRPMLPLPRPRPNTLNLQTRQQAQQLQQQREQLNIQLRQHFQQHNKQAQQCEQQAKFLRKAPLPPIAPKPVFGLFNHNNNNSNNNCTSPQSQSSYSNESNLTSPISSCGESEISVNVSLSSPTAANVLTNNNKNAIGISPHNAQQLKSPIRHRSFINVQPELPYARELLASASTQQTSGGGAGGCSNNSSCVTTPTSQKSFTSVNLTLRQPNSAVPQSTIDISAGPALLGSGGGLTYSSTSYDARRGYQKKFHITVTDQGGVFNASRLRPRSCYYPGGEHEADSPGAGAGKDGVNPLRTVASEHNVLHATQQQQQQQQQQQLYQRQQQYTVATSNEDMCQPAESDACSETLQRQKARRDKLATALRENKKKLGHVEEQINMLTEPINIDESKRLDYEIERLRSDCQLILNEIEYKRKCDPSQQPNLRPPRPLPPSVARSPIQQSDFCHSSAASSTPNSPHTALPTTTTAYYQPSTDEEEYSDSNTDGADDEEPLEMWACELCTFRNHPQLNICECCDNVRILPGRLILPGANTAAAAMSAGTSAAMPPTAATATTSAAAAATPTAVGSNLTTHNSLTPNATSNANLESDTNLTQQQLQQFALHT